MTTLELSAISSFPFDEILAHIGQKKGLSVNLRQMGWETAWSDIIREAIYRNPMDVSEVGSSWITDLRTMDVLHPFTDADVRGIEGNQPFLSASWENCASFLDCQIWSIPWTVDTRFVFYRKDLLEKAGVDIATAFSTHQNMINTLQALKDAGISAPLTLPTRRTRMVLHHAASWVWGNGGDFISADAKSAIFSKPQAIQGLCQHFELARFMPPETRNLESTQSETLYRQGKAAVTISGPWLLYMQDVIPEVREYTEFTFPPGVPFIGGTNLILWQQSTTPQAALELIHYLTSVEFQSSYFKQAGYLPSRLDALASPAFSNDPRYRTLAPGLQRGRSFKPMPLWGWFEERFTAALRQMWEEIFLAVDGDPAYTVNKYLPLLEQRVNLTLQQKG